MKNDFKPFKVGTVFNPIKLGKRVRPKYRSVEILFPTRLNAMALDPSKIVSNRNLVYVPGEIVFMVKLYKKICVRLSGGAGELKISKSSFRKPLIKHAVCLMRQALGVNGGLYVNVDNEGELQHCGLGSSSSLIAGVAVAINELYANPIRLDVLARYLAQNHGEEIDGQSDYIMPVQCIGGSAIGGFFDGGMKVLAGETSLIKSMDIPKDYKAVLGVPKDFKVADAQTLLNLEIKNLNKFLNTGLKYGEKIAYNILHKLLPAMTTRDFRTIGDVIFDYRFKMGSIKNCSFVYPKLVQTTNNLIFLKQGGLADILAISSVGPGIFVITKKPRLCQRAFVSNGLKTKIVDIENNRYKIQTRC